MMTAVLICGFNYVIVLILNKVLCLHQYNNLYSHHDGELLVTEDRVLRYF